MNLSFHWWRVSSQHTFTRDQIEQWCFHQGVALVSFSQRLKKKKLPMWMDLLETTEYILYVLSASFSNECFAFWRFSIPLSPANIVKYILSVYNVHYGFWKAFLKSLIYKRHFTLVDHFHCSVCIHLNGIKHKRYWTLVVSVAASCFHF